MVTSFWWNILIHNCEIKIEKEIETEASAVPGKGWEGECLFACCTEIETRRMDHATHNGTWCLRAGQIGSLTLFAHHEIYLKREALQVHPHSDLSAESEKGVADLT